MQTGSLIILCRLGAASPCDDQNCKGKEEHAEYNIPALTDRDIDSFSETELLPFAVMFGKAVATQLSHLRPKWRDLHYDRRSEEQCQRSV